MIVYHKHNMCRFFFEYVRQLLDVGLMVIEWKIFNISPNPNENIQWQQWKYSGIMLYHWSLRTG